MKQHSPNNNEIKELHQAVRSLNDKDIFITKADKGNAVFVLNKDDYDVNMQGLIDSGPYKRVKNPLNKIKNEISNAIKKYEHLFGMSWKWTMHTTYNRVPKIYGLPKIHKTGNKFRPVVSYINAPAYLNGWFLNSINLRVSTNFQLKMHLN